MKLLFDFFPILLFFIAYKMYDIYIATGVAIAASVLQVALFWWQYKRVDKMHLITLGLVVLLGGATLLLHDEMFIKWKPTLVNWLFALVFLGSYWFSNKTILQRMLADQITLQDEHVWVGLNWAWVGFFTFSGALNLFVVYQFSTDTWVNFKLFGLMGLTLIFVIAQGVVLARYIVDEEENAKPETPSSEA